jgi:hypothetical protein
MKFASIIVNKYRRRFYEKSVGNDTLIVAFPISKEFYIKFKIIILKRLLEKRRLENENIV